MDKQEASIRRNTDLRDHNTLHVAASAARFATIVSVAQLQDLLQSTPSSEPLYVIGGGSNILFLDDFDGLVLHVAIAGKEIVKEDEESVWLKVGAGENWHQLVCYCVEKGWGGIENLSLIPGTVGAAPIQNIGAYGVEFEQVFDSLTAVNRTTAAIRSFSKEACAFGYRDSIFKGELKDEFIITDVTVRLSKQPEVTLSYGAIEAHLAKKGVTEPDIRDVSDAVISIRKSKLPDPSQLANAGSFFKNPVITNPAFKRLKEAHPGVPGYPAGEGHTKVPAGWLIEHAGWKGRTEGPVGTYERQALVIVNHGGASGREIWSLAEKIQQAVKHTFDIDLVPEVNIVS